MPKNQVTGRSPVRFLQDIFDLAGGSTQLAAKLNIHAFTAENWRKRGIHHKYWDTLYKLYGLTPAELYTVSKKCREGGKKGAK